MTTRERLLADIAAHLARTGMSEATFSYAITGDRRLVRRLRAGASVTLTIIERIESAIAAGSMAEAA